LKDRQKRLYRLLDIVMEISYIEDTFYLEVSCQQYCAGLVSVSLECQGKEYGVFLAYP
jgi:hypothetical protein